MSKIIDTIYAARSGPQRLKEEAAEEADLLVDDTDEIDWQFFGNGRGALFERKTAQDLINSFLEANEATGEPRVVAQLRRLEKTRYVLHWNPEKHGYDYMPLLPVLLVEGHIYNRRGYAYADGAKRNIPFNAVDNFLLLVQRWGILVARSASLNHTMARMVSIAESWLNTGDKAPIIMLPKAPVPQLRTLMTLPRIGYKSAKKALTPFRVDDHMEHPTLRDVLHDLVHGNPTVFGPAADKRIQEYLNGPISSQKEGE